MKFDNPKNWKNPFQIVDEGSNIVSVWLPPVNHPEGELIMTINKDYIPTLIAALKRSEQSEGRKTTRRP